MTGTVGGAQNLEGAIVQGECYVDALATSTVEISQVGPFNTEEAMGASSERTSQPTATLATTNTPSGNGVFGRRDGVGLWWAIGFGMSSIVVTNRIC